MAWSLLSIDLHITYLLWDRIIYQLWDYWYLMWDNLSFTYESWDRFFLLSISCDIINLLSNSCEITDLLSIKCYMIDLLRSAVRSLIYYTYISCVTRNNLCHQGCCEQWERPSRDIWSQHSTSEPPLLHPTAHPLVPFYMYIILYCTGCKSNTIMLFSVA